MKKYKMTFLILVVGFMCVCASSAHADELAGNDSSTKLGRGLLNMVGSPVELARTIHIQSNVKGPAYGWTMGLVEGLGRTLVRFGAGAIETVTFPFDFPKDDKSPLLTPDYPWQKWDVQYL